MSVSVSKKPDDKRALSPSFSVNSKNDSISSFQHGTKDSVNEKQVAKSFQMACNDSLWHSEIRRSSIPRGPTASRLGSLMAHPHMNESGSEAVMSSNLALLIARDVSRRPPDVAKQREEAEKERLKKILDIRYNMAVDEREAFPDQVYPNKIMRRVPKSGLRVEYYAKGRKLTMAELSKVHKVHPSKVAATSKANGYVEGENLSHDNIDFIIDALSVTSDRLKSLSLVSKAFNQRVSLKLSSKTQQIAKEDAASAELEEAKQKIKEIPKAYFGAILKMPSLPPQEVIFVMKLVVLIIEKSPQLNNSISFDGEQAIQILRGYLEKGIDYTVSLILDEKSSNLHEDTVAAVEAAIAKEIKQTEVSSQSELYAEIRKFNCSTEALFAWAVGMTNLYRLRH
eukprot:Tbor_TRINITY_DN5845_c0_g3::TRINITY_DN5845_c0_g3_i1::g.6524::m.6524